MVLQQLNVIKGCWGLSFWMVMEKQKRRKDEVIGD